MFLAASRSRSWTSPQEGHFHVRSFRVRFLFTRPQVHMREDGSNLPMRIRFFPLHSHLYSNCRKNSLHATEEMPLARQWFFSIPATFKSSITMLSWFLTSFEVSLWRKSRRRLAMREGGLARGDVGRCRGLLPWALS